MSKRLALLIGVAEYDQPGIPDLPVVHNDIRDLASVLERSKYTVRKVGTGGGKDQRRQQRDRDGSPEDRHGHLGFCGTAPPGSPSV